MLWATVYDVEFFKHIENGMSESDADEEALKEANLVSVIRIKIMDLI